MEFTRREFLMAATAAGVAIPALAAIEGIQIGVCRTTRDLDKVVRYGFDYLEPPGSAIAAMGAARFRTFRSKVVASPIRCERFSDLMGQRGPRVVGDDVRWNSVRAYLDRTLARCRRLGGRVAVWSSPDSRNVPLGYSREKARKQIQEFLRRASGIARRHGMTIAIRPLRPLECNIINTGLEALQLVREVDRSNVRLALDYYRLRKEKESLDIIWQARKEIVHFYFANPHGQLWPKNPAEDPEYGEFFKLLKKIRYLGGISIDGIGSFARDAAASLDFFRHAITSA